MRVSRELDEASERMMMKDEDPYKFKVPPGGFGGRIMVCDMPKTSSDCSLES